MSTMPAVIVKKGGFLSSLFTGFFGLLITIVVCASGLGFYALHSVNVAASGLFDVSGVVISGLPDWSNKLPPLLAETLNDRRAPDYRDSVSVRTRLVKNYGEDWGVATLVAVENIGDETVTMLSMNVTLEDEEGVPVSERRVYAATPFTCDEDDWRGPLMPGESRKFMVRHHRGRTSWDVDSLTPSISVGELRLWNAPTERIPALTSSG